MSQQDSKACLDRFLLQRRVEKGSEFTHTSIGRPAASYYIPAEESPQFLDLYSRAVFEGHDLHLTERHRETGPVVIDVDLRFHEDDLVGTSAPRRVYTPAHVELLVQVYMEMLGRLVELGDSHTSQLVYVLEKPAPVHVDGRAKVKDGVHIVIPGVVTRPAVQFVARRDVLRDPRIVSMLEGLGITNSLTDVIDEAVIQRNNWQLYGSKKPVGVSAYALTRLYSFQVSTQTLQSVSFTSPSQNPGTLSSLIGTLSVRNKPLESHEVKPDRLVEVDNLERSMKAKAAAAVSASSANVMASMSMGDAYFCMPRNLCSSEHEFRTVEQLVDCLLPSRADTYTEWMRVGWCLRNIDWRLLTKWIDFSKRSPKYVDGECNTKWSQMRDCIGGGGLGIGSLHMWAKADNPSEYRRIQGESVRHLLLASTSHTHHDAARVVHALFGHEYVCASIRHKAWYHFHTHRWHPSDSAYTLRQKISTDVVRAYESLAAQCPSLAADNPDDARNWAETGEQLRGLAKKLKLTHFKDSVMRECAELFYREHFEENLDSKTNIIGFENGVYDLDAKEFRDGHPDDLLSFSTGIRYVSFDPQAPEVIHLERFLSQVFRDPEVREYVLTVLSSFLHGSIRQERFHIWTGSGSNGKSCCVDLFEQAFGDYCCKFPVALLTQKRVASNAATSELARAKGRRFACLQEPGEDERLNIGYMKELTGGDKVFARCIYKEPIEFKPQFKMILTCNHLPAVPSDDGGTWRRIRVVEFTSKFVEHPQPDNPHEFPLDTTLTSLFPAWAPHLLSMLIERFHLVHAEGKAYPEPEAVKQVTQRYQRDNNVLAEFFDSCVFKAPEGASPQPVLEMDALYDEFKFWIRTENPNSKALRKKEVQAYVQQRVGSTGAAGCRGGVVTKLHGYVLRGSANSEQP
jgi:P4 family phage/plasmid primase-like protien